MLAGSFLLSLLLLAGGFLLGFLLLAGGFIYVFLLLEGGFLHSLFVPLGITLLLAEDVEPDARINLGLLHLVCVGEGEGAADVCKLTWCEQVALGDSAIADDVDIDIGHLDELVLCLVHMGLDLANG